MYSIYEVLNNETLNDISKKLNISIEFPNPTDD